MIIIDDKKLDTLKQVKRLLAQHELSKQSIASMREMLNCMDGLEGIRYNGMPSHGEIGDPTMVLMIKREQLAIRLQNTERLVKLVDDALELLTESERLIVTRRYIFGITWPAITAESHFSRRQVFNIGQKGLRKMEIALFGS